MQKGKCHRCSMSPPPFGGALEAKLATSGGRHRSLAPLPLSLFPQGLPLALPLPSVAPAHFSPPQRGVSGQDLGEEVERSKKRARLEGGGGVGAAPQSKCRCPPLLGNLQHSRVSLLKLKTRVSPIISSTSFVCYQHMSLRNQKCGTCLFKTTSYYQT